MRRITVAVLGTLSSLVLLFAYPTSHNAPVAGVDDATADGSAPVGAQAPTGSTAGAEPGASASSGAPASNGGSGTFTGDSVDTRWGPVQVRITVESGRITAAEAVRYPSGNHHDEEINSYALPILAQEVLAAQSASIDAVSGATVTSDGYLQSLQSALDAAHL